jgi:hypothetical protein
MSQAPPCPVCKAANASGPTCRRCKADLSLLQAVEQERSAALASAHAAACAGDLDLALAHLRQADALRRGPDTRALLTAVWLLVRGYERGMPCPKPF